MRAQTVLDEGLVNFCHAQLPGQARAADGAAGCCAGAAVVAGNQHRLSASLGNACGNGAYAGFGNQLYSNDGVFVGVFQVVDQFGQVFNGVDVVVRRGRNQGNARGGVAGLGNPGPYLAARQVAAFAGLCALGHLDLDFLGAYQIFAGHAETTRGNLLDGASALAVQALG